MIHTKNINMNEYNFYKILRGKKITPDIMSISKDILKIQKYDGTLEELIFEYEPNNEELEHIYNKVKLLIKRLHKHNIFHYDLHSSNIVCNKEFTDFRIIDLEDATFIDIIDDEFIEDYNGMFDSNCETVEDLLNYELNESWKDF